MNLSISISATRCVANMPGVSDPIPPRPGRRPPAALRAAEDQLIALRIPTVPLDDIHPVSTSKVASPSLVVCLFSRHLHPQRATGGGPVERLGKHPIEIRDEVPQLALQVVHRTERAAPNHLPHDYSEHRSIWFSHELCFGVYTNRIRWPFSDRNACRLATDLRIPCGMFFLPNGSAIPHALATNRTSISEPWMFKLSTTKIHPASGLVATVCAMCSTKSNSCPRRADRGGDQLAGRHVEVADQSQRPMPRIFGLDPLGPPVGHRLIGGTPLQRLQPGHLIGADGVRPLVPRQGRRLLVGVTDRLDPPRKDHRIFLAGVEPIPLLVRLQGGLAEIATHLSDRDRGHERLA